VPGAFVVVGGRSLHSFERFLQVSCQSDSFLVPWQKPLSLSCRPFIAFGRTVCVTVLSVPSLGLLRAETVKSCVLKKAPPVYSRVVVIPS